MVIPEDFIESALEELQLQTKAHRSSWKLGEEKNWDVDLKEGILTLLFSNNTQAIIPIQVVGTHNAADNTFLWGWDHPSVPDVLSKHAFQAKKWGDINKLDSFEKSKIECTVEQAWKLAAVTSKLAKTNGVYRGVTNSVAVFMTLGTVKLNRIGQ